MRHNSLAATTCFLTLILSAAAWAGPLSGSSGVFTLPTATGPTSTAPGFLPTITNLPGPSFTGIWTTPALGTFSGTGPFPVSSSTSPATFDFSGLTTGFLPAGSFLRLSDLDTVEKFELKAYDIANNLITAHWLDDAAHVGGANPLEFVQAFMPSWTFSGGLYTLTGETATGNPLLLYSIPTNQNIRRIELVYKEFSAGFGVAAIPEPATTALLGIGLAVLGLVRVRQQRG